MSTERDKAGQLRDKRVATLPGIYIPTGYIYPEVALGCGDRPGTMSRTGGIPEVQSPRMAPKSGPLAGESALPVGMARAYPRKSRLRAAIAGGGNAFIRRFSERDTGRDKAGQCGTVRDTKRDRAGQLRDTEAVP